MDECILTTVDNPYNPFTEWNQWLKFDEDNGYETNSLLASFAKTSTALSDADNEKLIDDAMNTIIKLFPGVYKKVFKRD